MKGSRRCTAVVAAFGLLGACALFGVQSGRVVQAQEDPASRALAYLRTQQVAADGSIAESYADSELYVIAAAADGFDPNALTASSGVSVMTYLAHNASAACIEAGACGELIQAVVAAGDTSVSFGGQDLLTLLDASYDATTGEYGNGEAFTQALAIQGLVAAGQPVPAAAVTFLVDAQDGDGGWDYEAVKNDISNVYDTSDTNSTSMVLMALDAAGDHTDDASALKWLATQQDTDGGFQYQAGTYSLGSDPDSTALVVQAIVATGGDPFAVGWTKDGNTPLAYLESTQASDGGWAFPSPGSNPPPSPDAFTTSEVPLALLLQPFPVHATFSAGFTSAQEDHSILASLLYLQTQQQSDGSIPEEFGGYADSELYAIAAAADGYDPTALTASSGVSVMTYLAASVASACPPAPLLPVDLETSSGAGDCGELIQAVVAAGEDPTDFSGVNLISRLGGYLQGSGAYGDGEAFTQTLAIQGLVAAGAPVPSTAVTFLVNAQDSDGGWDYLDVAGDPSGSDTNSTSMVLMALDAAGDHACDATAVAWLATQQEADGGFQYQPGPYSLGSDPDSTALVVQAIVATGGDPYGSAWTTVSGNTPLGYLETTQDTGGGYTYPGNTGPDAFTTSEVPLALERLAFPVQFGSRQWYVPGATLGTPASPSASPTSTPTPASGPPAGVITAPPTPIPTESPTAELQVQEAWPAATPGAAPPPSTPVATTTTPSPAAQTSVGPSAPSTGDPPGGSPPALLIYVLVALGVAVVVGGGGMVLAARR